MPLQLPPSSRFAINPEQLPPEFVVEIHELLLKISRSRTTLQNAVDRQPILEEFKKHFSLAAAKPHYASSSAFFAEFDLRERMKEAAANAPVFLEALHDCLEATRTHGGFHVPDFEYVNDISRRHSVGYAITPPNLIKVVHVEGAVTAPALPESLAETAGSILNASMTRAEELLANGNPRGAVLEELWMLESLSTAFRGVKLPTGEVRGTYFNQIAKELRGASPGTTLERVMDWLSQLHGYLSAPAGGGIRHGLDLSRGTEVTPAGARLFINLILSYVTFLLSEHERLVTRHAG